MTMLTLCRNSKRGGMATHAGVALELGIIRPAEGKSRSVVGHKKVNSVGQ